MDGTNTLFLAWGRWIATVSWQLAALTILIGLAALAMRRLPARLRYGLWLLVLLKIFIPPSLAPVWSVGHWGFEPLWQSVQQTAPVERLESGVRSLEREVIRPESGVRSLEGEVKKLESGVWSLEGEASKNEGPSVSPMTILFILWLVGAGVFLGFVAWRYAWLARALRGATVLDEGPLRIEMERLAVGMGIKRTPDLVLSDRVHSPFLTGLWRPRIVLPASLPEEVGEAEMHHILLHELSHWRRGDLWIGWVQIVAQALLWFHPFVWFALGRLRHERECACDESVLAAGSCKPHDYGQLLINVLMASRARAPVALGLLGIFERGARLQERMEEIMRFETAKRKLGLSGWGFLILFALVFMPMGACQTVTGAQSPIEPSGKSDVVNQYRQALNKEVTVVAKGSDGGRLSVQYAVIAICEAAGVPYQFKKSHEFAGNGPRKFISPRVISKIPAREAITNILDPLDMHYRVDANGLFLAQGQAVASSARTRHFVRFVLGADKMTFEGREVAEDELAGLLEAVPDKPNTVLEFAIENESRIGLAKYLGMKRKLGKYVQMSGFEYLSFVGVHPLGSVGDEPQKVPIVAKKESQITQAPPASSEETEPHFVRFVLGEDKMTFEGQEVTEKELPGLLEAVPNKANTVLEFAITNENRISLTKYLDMKAKLGNLVQGMGFKILSIVGVKPLGSVGTQEGKIFIVTFRGNPSFNPQTPRQLLNAFNASHPKGVRTHHYRTRAEGDVLVGSICVDGITGRNQVVEILKNHDRLCLLEVSQPTPNGLEIHKAGRQESLVPKGPPRIIKTVPKVGATDVDPALEAIEVTFDRPMKSGYSWTGGGEVYPKRPEGQKPQWSADQKTCRLPVALEAGRYYRVGINSGKKFSNFRGAKGRPTETTAIYFTTRGASDEVKARVAIPKIVALDPPNGSKDVDPNRKTISVTFDVPMGGGMSWCGGGKHFPVGREEERTHWTEDRKTCVMPVTLNPDWDYKLWINAFSFKNFSSAWGVPVDSVGYNFKTKGE